MTHRKNSAGKSICNDFTAIFYRTHVSEVPAFLKNSTTKAPYLDIKVSYSDNVLMKTICLY